MRNLDTKGIIIGDKLKHIIKIINNNPNTAKICLDKYTKKYPNDVWGQLLYGSVLITLDNLDEADIALNKARENMYNSEAFRNNDEYFKNARHSLIYNRLRLFGYQNKAKEFLRLYKANRNILPEVVPHDVLYFKCLSGEKVSSSYVPSYFGSQILDYSEDRMLEYIKSNNATDEKKPNYCYFIPDFPFEKVIEEVKEKLPYSQKRNSKFFTNTYVFKYTGCGTFNEKSCDYFRVITLNNSNKIMTLYPISEGEDMEYTDLNYLKSNEESHVKRMTRIDKFNSRYGRETL